MLLSKPSGTNLLFDITKLEDKRQDWTEENGKYLFMEMSYEASYDPSSDKINPTCRQSVKMLLSSCGRAVTDSVSRLGKK